MIGFGKYAKREEPAIITSLADNRLVRINPQEDSFFDLLFNFKPKNSVHYTFIEAIHEVKDANLKTFYKPIYDPSEDGDMIVYQKGKKPALRHPYKWWVETASNMPAVEGRSWKVATEYQYYAFLVWLINRLVIIEGKSVEVAINMVVFDSKELGHYADSKASRRDFEPTGSRCVCGVYDLANVFKFLTCSNEEAGGFWIGSGEFADVGYGCPLANLDLCTAPGDASYVSVGCLVL